MKIEPLKHDVLYVTADLEVVPRKVRRITPDRLKASCPPGSKFVIRMGPRSKQWEVYDLRRYLNAQQHGQYGQFYKAPPPSVLTDNRDSAIGWAMLS